MVVVVTGTIMEEGVTGPTTISGKTGVNEEAINMKQSIKTQNTLTLH